MKVEPAKAEKGDGSEAGADTKPMSDPGKDAKGGQQPRPGQGQSEQGKSDSASPQPGAEGKTDPSGASSNKPSDASKADQANAAGNQGSRPDSSAGQESPGGDGGKKASEPSGSPSASQSSDQKPGEGSAQDPSSEITPGRPGANPGHGNELTPQAGGSSSSPALLPKAEAKNEDFARRSGELNLEKVDPKKLRELFQKYNLTEEEYRNWLAGQTGKNPRAAVPGKAGDFQAADRSGSGVNTGVQRVERPQDPSAGKLSAGNTGQAPPEYRKAAERFAEQLAKPPEPKPR